MELAVAKTKDGIKVYDYFGLIDVVFPYDWINQFIDHYCFNVINETHGDYYLPQTDIDILKFAEAECILRQGLCLMGSWGSWMQLENSSSEAEKLERVSYRVEKAFRMGIGSLAMTAIKYGFPCDTTMGNSEDNQLYAYIVAQLIHDFSRWN